MKTLLQKPDRAIWFLIFFYIIVSLINLGGWGVIESSEARYAEISREMVRSGDWLHPTLLEIKHYHKPPVTYWITGVGYLMFGVNDFGARFFLVIAFAIQLLLVYQIAAQLLKDKKQALTTATVYATLPIVLVSARGLTTDCFLNTFILAAIHSWLLWRNRGHLISLYLTGLWLGLGFLTKGPVVLIVPAMVFVGLGRAQQGRSWSVHHLVAGFLFLAIAVSWFVAVAMEKPEVLNYFLFRQTVERLAHAEVFQRAEPWWYYLAFGPLLALPWPLVFTFRRSALSPIVKRVLGFWVIGPLIFFSIASSKLVLYILSVYAGVAMLVAFIIHGLTERQGKIIARIILMYFILLSGALVALPIVDESIKVSPYLSAAPVFMVVILLVLAWVLRRKSMEAIHGLPTIFTGFLLVYATFILGENELKYKASRPIAQWIAEHRLANRPILVYDKLLPSLSFELDRPITSLYDGNRNVDREVQFEETDEWKERYFVLENRQDQERLKNLLSKPTALITRGELKGKSAWITSSFHNQVNVSGWVIYY